MRFLNVTEPPARSNGRSGEILDRLIEVDVESVTQQELAGDPRHGLVFTVHDECFERAGRGLLPARRWKQSDRVTVDHDRMRGHDRDDRHLLPGDRIAVDDAQNLERFINGEKTTWKVSGLQKLGDWVSLLSLVMIVLTVLLVSELVSQPRNHLLHHHL